MNYKEDIGQSNAITKVEDEVESPEKIGNLEDKPSNFRIEIDVGDGVRKSAVVEFDASEYKPS